MSRSRCVRLIVSACVVTLCAVLVRADSSAAGSIPENQGAIARTALTAVGQYTGEWFPWARSVVLAATGRLIGFDYRTGYLQAGGGEVTVQDARNSDAIHSATD